MHSLAVKGWIVRVALAALLSLTWLAGSNLGWLPAAPTAHVAYAQGGLDTSLLAEGEKHQVIQFNPGAALQKRIFADGFVPNSAEFSLTFEGADYAAQRAENLGSGVVRVYFVRVGDWGNVRFTQGGDALGNALVAQGQQKQVIQFNPGAALQKQIFADGFVPNSSEFGLQMSGASYSAQRAENLGNGQVRVYYVVVGDWGNVRNAARGGSSQAANPPAAPAAPPVTTVNGDTATVTEGDVRVDVLRQLPPPPAQLTGAPSKRIDEATVQLVVLTRTDAGIATGTVVGPDGRTILTAFHVVGDLQTGKVYDPLLIAVGPYLDYKLRATVVATDAENDLAVIRVQPHEGFGGFTFLSLANSDAMPLGELTYVYSYPARREGGLGRSTGSLLAIGSNVKDGARRVFLTDSVASPGSSGGVVVNSRGEVMGIISYGVKLPRGIDRPGLPTITQLTGFIPINSARPLLNQAGVP